MVNTFSPTFASSLLLKCPLLSLVSGNAVLIYDMSETEGVPTGEKPWEEHFGQRGTEFGCVDISEFDQVDLLPVASRKKYPAAAGYEAKTDKLSA
ncbi:hypothetical protein [Methylocaldum sp.]|uniref:hypothetical protein n=1 Tax=Methylocaldum sp. TaxID=1969727 RepID=UPI002D6A0D22|nr:hypothetical protein [Methylocaldum sp.]HYE34092.1 hypothetical protein [Methylocaldum sp.]